MRMNNKHRSWGLTLALLLCLCGCNNRGKTPDILVDIQMNRYGTFDFDKSEKLIAIGRKKTAQVISKYEGIIPL